MNDVVSIIIPVFNAENYLPRCLDSILNQTYKDIEIILVDDGSTDGTVSLCEEFCKKNKNIILKQLAHGGVSKARNAGLELIHGRYFTFVDSDDWIDKTYVEKMIESIKDNQAEIAVCGYIKYFDENKQEQKTIESKESMVTGEELILSMIKPKGTFTALWNKMYLTALVKDEERVRHYFDEDYTIGEDEVWLVDLLVNVNRVVYVNEALYVWVQREGSITHTQTFQRWKLTELKAKERVKKTVEQGNAPAVVRELARLRLSASLIKYTRLTYFYEDKEDFDRIKQYRRGKVKLKDYFALHDAPLKHQVKVLLVDVGISLKIPNNLLIKFF